MFMKAAIDVVNADTTQLVDPQWQPGDGPIPAIRYKTERDTISKFIVGPKMQEYLWGQENPEGILYPNGKCGCSNTAIFLIMAYFKSPNSIVYTYPDAEVQSQDINWNLVLKHKKPTTIYISEIINTISRVCRQLGELGNSDFSSPYETLTFASTYYSTLKTVMPSKTITQLQTFDFDTAKQYISAGMVLMRGDEYQLDNSGYPIQKLGGHAWVVDGCSYTYVCVYTYKKEYDDEDWVLESTSYERKKLLSINWGWNGDKNGYFRADVLNPRSTTAYNLRYLDTQFIGIK